MGKYVSIESYIRNQGISLREFANRCGIAPSTMSRFLSGKTDIQKSNIDKILKVTGMSYEECFKEEIFLPYIETNNGQNIYERLEERQFLLEDNRG